MQLPMKEVEARPTGIVSWLTVNLGRIVISLFVPVITFIVLWQGFLFLRDSNAPKLVIAAIAILWGGAGVGLLYLVSNWLVEQMAPKWVARLQPFVFVGPAIAVVIYYLALPTVRTLFASLLNRDGTQFVGLANYITVFTQPFMLVTFRNNLLWIVFGASLTVIVGLLVATLADRSRFETVAKAIIFMPLAISLVGAGVIWKFVYAVKDVSDTQIGLLNARFVDPTGLAPTNVASPQDLALLVAEASNFPQIREYSTTPELHVTLPNSKRPMGFSNTNALVRSSSSGWDIGLSKTGYINEAGKCLVMHATIANNPVVIVLLDSWGKLTRVGDANRIKKWLENSKQLAAFEPKDG